jgi:hypothetical protein
MVQCSMLEVFWVDEEIVDVFDENFELRIFFEIFKVKYCGFLIIFFNVHIFV